MAYTVALPNGQTVEVPDDVSPDQAYAEIQRYWEEMNRPPAEGGFVPAVKSGFSELKSGIAALLGKTGAIDEKTATDYIAEQERYQQQTFKPTTESWTEAPFQHIKELAGQSLPWMAAPVGAAGAAFALPASVAGASVLGGATTVGSAVATGAALLAGATQYTGSNLKRQLDEGESLQSASLGSATAAAVPQALLDRFAFGMIPGLNKIFGVAGKQITEETAAAFAKQGLAKTVADYTASTGKAMTAEGLTEAAQQFLERMQAGLQLNSPEARDEYWQSLIGGAVLGGTMAPVGRFLERGSEQAQAGQLLAERDRRLAAEAAQTQQEEQASKDSPEYAERVSAEYLSLEDQIKQLRGQLIKEDEASGTATADKLHNEGINKQIDALQPKLKELASEYNRVKNLPKPEAAAPAEPVAPEFIPEDVAARLQNPLGKFTQAEVGPDIWKAVNRYRKDQGKPLLSEYSIEDIRGSMPGVNPKAEQGMVDSLIAARTGYQEDIRYTPEMLLQAAKTAGVDTTTKGFNDFLQRSTGTSELSELSQPQMHVVFKALTELEPSETNRVLPEGTNATHFSEKQYQNFLKVFGLEKPAKPLDEGMMLEAVKEATNLTSNQDAKLLLDEAVKRGDIDQQKRTVFRVVDPKTNQVFTTVSNEEGAKNIAAKRGYEVRAEDVNDYTLGAPKVARTGFGIEEGYAKTGEAPSGFAVTDGDKVLHIAKTEADAKARAAQIATQREGMAKATESAIAKLQANMKNADNTLVKMEAQGLSGTPQYTAAKVKIDAFKRKTQEQIKELQQEAESKKRPLTIKPAAPKPTEKKVFKVTEKGLESEFATAKEAEEYILANASPERLADLAQNGYPLIAKRAQSELRRRSEAAEKAAEEAKAAEAQKAQDAADEAQIKELEAQLKPLLTKFGMGDVALNISKALRGGGVEAEYVNKVITLAIDVANPVRTMRHESLHALHDLGFFTDGQWKMLNNMADKVWIDKYLKQRAPDGTPLQPGQVSRFERYQQLYGKDNIEALREEAIADAFGDFDANGAPKGVFATLLQKMRDFFESLKNVFTGAGYGTAEGVFRKVEAGELKPTKEGGGSPTQAKPSVANAFKANKAEEEQAKKYEEANGILPYTSQGYLNVPVKYSIKGFNPKKDYGTHPLTGQPLNKDGTLTVYYHTTKAKALEIGNKKFIPADGKRRIYLTNESSGAEILRDKGNFDHELDGSTVLINIDPNILQIDKQYDNGRMDFFIPTAQGNAFYKKMQMQSIQKSRQEAITDKFSYEDHEKRISAAVKAFKALKGTQRAAALKKARDFLKAEHNVNVLMTENGKLEKTRTGEYQSGLTVESNIASMGLGLASAQKITDKANTCPRSAICEGLCLGETSGGNFMFGGAASEDVGDISKSSFRAAARMFQYLKTEALIMHPEEFAIVLQGEIDAHTKWCEKETEIKKSAVTGAREKVAKELYAPAFRLNVTSDFKPEMFRGIIEGNPQAMFYDYTKLGSEPIAKNHHLTYSSTGFGQIVDGEKVFFKNKAGQYDHNWATMRKRLDNGQNVAMAFSSKSAMPKFLIDEETGVKYAVLNGDDYDARFLDEKTKLKKQQKGRGVIVGLKNKAGNLSEKNSTKKTGGFFVNYDPKVDGDTVVVPDQAQFKQKTIPIAKASLRSAPDTPEFKRWFGDSKIVDETGKPLVMYHGTPAEYIDVFQSGRHHGLLFFTTEEPWAEEWADERSKQLAEAHDGDELGYDVLPVYIRSENPWDYQNPKHVKELINRLERKGIDIDESYREGIEDGDWMAIEEGRGALDAIKEMGHDGIWITEGSGMTRNLAVFSPHQIKSATENSGKYSRTNPDIRASLRSNVSPIGFYSALLRGVDDTPIKASTAQGWKDAIKGLINKGAVKAEEVEWTGLNDWLDLQAQPQPVYEDGFGLVEEMQNDSGGWEQTDDLGMYFKSEEEARAAVSSDLKAAADKHGAKEGAKARISVTPMRGLNFGKTMTAKVTKEQVQEFLKNNGVQVEEVQLEEKDGFLRMPGGAEYGDPAGAAKYSQYTLPGGENYREVLLTLPVSTNAAEVSRLREEAKKLEEQADIAWHRERDQANSERLAQQARELDLRADEIEKTGEIAKLAGSNYRSSHWDQPNVLAHIRLNDRTDADGKRVLFVEEIQSDWGQEGKKRGFKQSVDRDAIESRMQAITARLREIAKTVEPEKVPELADEWNRLSDEKSQLTEQLVRSNSGVPTAPFVTKTEGWLNLALKRIMVMAAEGGYDRVAFTDAEPHFKRWGTERIDWAKQPDGSFLVKAKSQEGGDAAGINLEAEAIARGLSKSNSKTVRSVKELEDAIRPALTEGQKAEDLAPKIWQRMQAEDAGTAMPRREGFEAFYGDKNGMNPKTGTPSFLLGSLKPLLKKVGGGQMGVVEMERGQPSRSPSEATPFLDWMATNHPEVKRVDAARAWSMGVENNSFVQEWYDTVRRLQQPGFDVTPEMRSVAGNGLPLFSLRSAPNTPEFKRWFGDSKVVDADGKPLVVYHGTRGDFSVFDTNAGKGKGLTLGPGAYFSESPTKAEAFAGEGGSSMPVYLSLQNPLEITRYTAPYFGMVNDRENADIRAKGYDGIILRSEDGKRMLEVVAFSPNQIKSAIGNKGQFDAANPDIRASLREAPQFSEDIPNDNWLKGKVDYAKSEPRSKYGVPRMSTVTGSFSKPVMLPVDMVKTVPGSRGEQSNVRKDSLNAIRKIMADTGKLPLTDRGEEYAPFITIGYDGKPWVSEGNHRIMAAAAEGWKTIPVEVRYFDGGQREAGAWAPDKLLEKDRAATPKASVRETPEGVNADDWARHQDNMAEWEKTGKKASVRNVKEEINQMPGGASIWNNIQQNTGKRVEKNFVERILESLAGDNLSRIRAAAIHRYNRLGEAEAIRAKMYGTDIRLADENAESAALMSDLGASVATASFGFGRNKGGIPVYRNGVTTIDNSKKGLLEVFKPLAAYGDPEIYRAWQHYMGIKRGNRLDAQGKPTQYSNVSPAEAQALEQKFPEFAQVRDDWLAYNNGVMQYLVDTGVLSQEKANIFMQHADYIPFYRELDGDTTGPQIFSGISGVKQLKKLKGGEEKLGDMLETVIRNSQAAITMGMKNVAGQRAVKLAEDIGTATRLQSAPANMDNVITVMENGEKAMYLCADPLFINAVKSLNMAELPFINILSAPANLLRSMVTKDPGFILANMLRDSVDAYIRTGVKMTPIVDTLANFSKNVVSLSPELQKLYNAGILGGYEASGAIPETAGNAAKELRKRTGTRTTGEKLAAPFTSLWGQLENLTEASDAATRIAVYNDTLRRTGNEAEALFQALEVMNFHRKGASPIVRIATAAIPFLNARLQGLDNLFRAGIKPLYDSNATTRQKQLQKTMLVRGLTILGLSAMYAMAVTGDPEYEKQEDETRDNNWIIPIGNTHIKIPVPFEIGTLFKTVPERAYRAYLGIDTPQDTWDSANRAIRSTFAFNPMPQAFNPLYEVQTNYSQYTRRPIISAGMENIAPAFQYDGNTPAMFRVIGEATGLSPKKMEHLWQGYTGTMGTYAVQLMDSVFDGMGMPLQASKRFEQQPFIKRFVADPEARGQVTAFYDLKNRVDEVVRTVNLLQKEGSPELPAYLQENATLYAARGVVSSINQQLTTLNGYAKQIRASDMKPDEKRDLLLQITKTQNELTNNIRMVRKTLMQEE